MPGIAYGKGDFYYQPFAKTWLPEVEEMARRGRESGQTTPPPVSPSGDRPATNETAPGVVPAPPRPTPPATQQSCAGLPHLTRTQRPHRRLDDHAGAPRSRRAVRFCIPERVRLGQRGPVVPALSHSEPARPPACPPARPPRSTPAAMMLSRLSIVCSLLLGTFVSAAGIPTPMNEGGGLLVEPRAECRTSRDAFHRFADAFGAFDLSVATVWTGPGDEPPAVLGIRGQTHRAASHARAAL